MHPSILTASGRFFDFAAPTNFDINDIAHALSHLCRFTGHCRAFYSVAQHSVLTSYLVPEPEAMSALLHDAHEAYVGDMAAPLKVLMPEYKALETAIQTKLREAFRVPAELSPAVKHADLTMLATERRDLMPDSVEWAVLNGVTPHETRVIPCSPKGARDWFLLRFNYLKSKGY